MGKVYTILLLGNIASGKSLISSWFAEKDVLVVDADVISHQLTSSGGAAIEPIRAAFGNEVIDDTGALDRRKMRNIIFNCALQKKRLEEILHPAVSDEARRQLDHAQGPYALFVLPLIKDTASWSDFYQRILLIRSSREQQKQRLTETRQLSNEMAEAMINAQSDLSCITPDDLIENNASIQVLHTQILALHQCYLKLAAEFVGEKNS